MANFRVDRQPRAALSAPGVRTRLRRGAAGMLFVLVAGWPPAGALAEAPAVEALGGWEGDSRAQGYGFAGAGVLFPTGARLGVPLRAFGSYLYYDFNSSGATTQVTSPGVTVLAGIRLTATRGNFTVLGGGEVRQERRSVETTGGTTEDVRTSGVVLQADGDAALGRHWRGYLFGNYGGASRYFYGRAAMRYQVTNLDWMGPRSFFLGFEGARQGNDESDAIQGGGFAEWNFIAQRVSLVVRGGYKESWSPGEDHLQGGYFGIGLYHRF